MGFVVACDCRAGSPDPALRNPSRRGRETTPYSNRGGEAPAS